MGILNNSIVGTILAMMLIYALLSILVSLLLEAWNQIVNTRAKNLKEAIGTMIDGQNGSNLMEKFYNHYMVAGQTKSSDGSDDGKNDEFKDKPITYISEKLFTEVFTDIISSLRSDEQKADDEGKKRMDIIKQGIESITDNDQLKELLQSFYIKAEGEYEKFESHLKEWFLEFMGRVSGWYKKAQRYKLFIAGLLVAIGLNVDSIFLFNVISKNDTLRNELVKVAENVSEEYSALDSIHKEDPNQLLKITKAGINQIIDSTKTKEQVADTVKLNAYVKKLENIVGSLDSIEQKKYTKTKEALALVSDLSIPIGWKEDRAPLSWKDAENDKESLEDTTNKSVLQDYLDDRNKPTFWNIILYVLGILISAFSLSYGAPFWFEMLSKLVNLRKLGKS